MANDTTAIPAAPAAQRRTTSVYLPVELLARLDELAEREERSRSWLVEKAIVRYLSRSRGAEIGADDEDAPRRTVSVYLAAGLLARLDKLAAADGLSRTFLVERAIVEYMSE